jgi:pimeloyl-ACP methyl ester carboxylesterase
MGWTGRVDATRQTKSLKSDSGVGANSGGNVFSSDVARAVVATALAVLIGVVPGIIMPRGPIDSGQGAFLIMLSLASGAVVGYLAGTRWSLLFAPILQLAAFELTRIDESGPSVDGIRFEFPFGVMTLIVGRGIWLLLAAFPLTVGCAWGCMIYRRGLNHWNNQPTRMVGRFVRKIPLGVATMGVVALTVLVSLPASVPAVEDTDGHAIAGEISELTSVNLGGYEQWIEINGANPANPVVLYLNGGPGQSDLALSRVLLAPLHQDFTVVGWDQRGAGKSYASLDSETLDLEAIVSDTIELTNYLRDRFQQDKIYLLTESWGSIPGVLAAQRHPELYHAYIGSGQMVSVRATDTIIYQDLQVYAQSRGDTELLNKLESMGPPPYASIWDYAFVMQNYEKLEGDYDPPQTYTDRADAAGVGFWGIMGSEYTFLDKFNVVRGLLDMAAVMYPQIQDVDFREQVPSLEIPVYIFLGGHELRGRSDLVHQWFDGLQAPTKQLLFYEDAGHAPAFEHADDLHTLLVEMIEPSIGGGK